MEIKIQISGRVFSICIGRETKWFSQMDLITVTEEFYDEKRNVNWANMIFSFWRKPVCADRRN